MAHCTNVQSADSAKMNALPPGESVLSPSGLASFSLFGIQKDLGALSIVKADYADFHQALQIKTEPGARAEWLVQVVAPVTQEVKKGDVLLGHFCLRCANSMTGEGYTTFVFEMASPPFDKAVEFRISSRSMWKEVFVPFVAPRNFPAGKARIALRAGFDRQTIQIGGIEVIDYQSKVKVEDLPQTKITYPGRSPDAQWRKDALARIEKIRKGDLDIYVADAAGAPVSGAEVHAVLRKHAFGFGTCVDADLILGTTPNAQRYRQTILGLFNRAVFENEMKWQATWNGVPPDVDRALQWLREHDIAVRGHNLVWPSWQWLPTELKAYKNDPAKLREITDKHITYMVSHFRGKLVDWDVVNEPFTNHDLIDLLGGRQIMVHWFDVAHQADPNCRLFLNDFGILDGGKFNEHRENFYDNIQFLKSSGAPIGGIGIQSHFGTELPPPEQILKILDRFSVFGLPIESTEVSISLHDKQLQADYLRDYMIAMFSEPAVKDIMLWGFWQGRHWRPEAGIFADDWSAEPAAKVWIDLTQKQWSTDATVKTSDSGLASVRGFYGSYDITVTANGQSKTVTADLTPGGSRVKIQME
ncbi:MAG TPA: endo-1,4-beta-xylanase [Tepidisphaeraceae bacterium]|nr:endo-1,4-beta-xylanase [Tepidisphaeraceae bacterium]